MNQIFIRVASGVRYGFDEAANFAVVDVSGRKVGFVAQEQVFRAVMEANRRGARRNGSKQKRPGAEREE